MKKSGDILYSLRRYDYLEGNFTQISNDVFKLTNGNEFKIYCYLCSNYNKELGYSFPSLNTISKNTNMSVPTVTKCIKSLEKLGLIKMCKFESGTLKSIHNGYELYFPEIEKTQTLNNVDEEFLDELKRHTWDFEDIENKIYTYKFEYNEPNKCDSNRKDYKYSKWRNSVLQRDDYKCKMCGKSEDESILNVHHIIRYADNEELRTDADNGITLCYECHKKIFGKEKEFEEYFKQLIKK